MKKIKLATGLRDEVGPVAEQKDLLSHQILTTFRHKGYTRIITPLLEDEALFQDYELRDQMYKFVDASGRSLVLRPDLTLPVARFLANNNISLPRKFYYLGDELSIGRQFMGQQNEITQAGVELVGFQSVKAEIECLLIIHWISERFLDNQLTVELGDSQLVTRVLAELTVDGQAKDQIAKALFAKNFPRYQQLIAGLQGSPQFAFLRAWPRLFGSVAEIKAEIAGIDVPAVAQPMIDRLLKLATFVQTNLAQQKVIIDLSSAVPQKYYTGVIFKAYTAQSNEYVISGGRYDRLLADFREQAEAAVGLGINLDLLAQLAARRPDTKNKLVFATLEDYPTALKVVREHPNYSLAVGDTLAAAREEAAAAGMELITIGGE